MNKTVSVLLAAMSTALLVSGCSQEVQTSSLNATNIPKSLTAAGVWQQVQSDAYQIVPTNEVSLWKFASSRFNPSPDLLAERAAATVFDHENIIPYFEKLVHPNGICLKGKWVITEDSPFTGAFAKGTVAPFVGRSSVAFSDVTRGSYRAFGLAGKVFQEVAGSSRHQDYETGNFFTVDDLGGTLTDNYTDAVFSNEPALSKTNMLWQGPSVMAIAAATVVAFSLADSNPGIRQLWQLSELGLKDRSSAVTPKWMHLQGLSSPKSGNDDFRDDLRMGNFDGPLEFAISVSSVDQDSTTVIGKIVIEETVTSESCDHRLHFNHPQFRDDLTYE